MSWWFTLKAIFPFFPYEKRVRSWKKTEKDILLPWILSTPFPFTQKTTATLESIFSIYECFLKIVGFKNPVSHPDRAGWSFFWKPVFILGKPGVKPPHHFRLHPPQIPMESQSNCLNPGVPGVVLWLRTIPFLASCRKKCRIFWVLLMSAIGIFGTLKKIFKRGYTQEIACYVITKVVCAFWKSVSFAEVLRISVKFLDIFREDTIFVWEDTTFL